MAGIGNYKKGGKFTLRSGNTPSFKGIGSSPVQHREDEESFPHEHGPKDEIIHGSPTKQTKSGKGNIFTKKGRIQRLVNKHYEAPKGKKRQNKRH